MDFDFLPQNGVRISVNNMYTPNKAILDIHSDLVEDLHNDRVEHVRQIVSSWSLDEQYSTGLDVALHARSPVLMRDVLERVPLDRLGRNCLNKVAMALCFDPSLLDVVLPKLAQSNMDRLAVIQDLSNQLDKYPDKANKRVVDYLLSSPLCLDLDLPRHGVAWWHHVMLPLEERNTRIQTWQASITPEEFERSLAMVSSLSFVYDPSMMLKYEKIFLDWLWSKPASWHHDLQQRVEAWHPSAHESVHKDLPSVLPALEKALLMHACDQEKIQKPTSPKTHKL